jgi:hypothetical protein
MNGNIPLQTSSNMPSELSGQVPRIVRLSDSSQVALRMLAVLVAITVIGCLWYGNYVIREVQQRSALRLDGVEVTGEITQLKRAGKGPDVVHYTFIVSGKTFAGMTDVTAELMPSLQQSNRIIVRYLPSDPTVNHPAWWEWSLLSEWPVIFILLAFGLASSATSISFFKARKVLVYGKPAAGTLKSHGSGSRKASYEFLTPTGTRVTGNDYISDLRQVGSSVWIVYMPENPRRNVLYPSVSFYVEQ